MSGESVKKGKFCVPTFPVFAGPVTYTHKVFAHTPSILYSYRCVAFSAKPTKVFYKLLAYHPLLLTEVS